MKANVQANSESSQNKSINTLNGASVGKKAYPNKKQPSGNKGGFKQRNEAKNKYNKPLKNNIKKATDKRPPFAFLVMELTGLEQSLEKIIRISEIIQFADGETEKNTYLFNCGDHKISEESTKYHGIKNEDLIGKPDLSSYDFKKAKNIVVWDSRVVFNMLKTNGIEKFSPMISLHSLARLLEESGKSISIKNYASKCEPHLKNIIEFRLKNPLNKVEALTTIFKCLEKKYAEKYDCERINANFLYNIGLCSTKKDFDEAIKEALPRLKAWNFQIKRKLEKENNELSAIGNIKPSNEKKVIVVKKTQNSLSSRSNDSATVVKKKVITVAKKTN